MTKRLIVLLAASLAIAGRSLAGDTGTYRIAHYVVDLTPRSDGAVETRYYQKWLVTGGHIPWITVGTANGKFEITGHGGAAKRVAPAGGGGWSGVRIDLDRDYRPGETFEVAFSIVQRGLFYADGETYGLEFTPGWYDRAVTETLRVGVTFFARLGTVDADPPPSFVAGDEMVWIARDLGPGERFSIRLSFPAESFPAGMAAENLRKARGAGGSTAFVVIALAIFVISMLVVITARRSSAGRYSGGRVFYGGIPGGGGFRGGGSGGRRSTGGGGGFGGSSMSCACACVSCACACACAGGGGAGCSRKTEHICPACAKEGES
jgi:hypothetical protein